MHTACILRNGKILVTGGSNGVVSSAAELYDPLTGNWTATRYMNDARKSHTSTLLTNGKVLLTGGDDGMNLLNIGEFYDPLTGN